MRNANEIRKITDGAITERNERARLLMIQFIEAIEPKIVEAAQNCKDCVRVDVPSDLIYENFADEMRKLGYTLKREESNKKISCVIGW